MNITPEQKLEIVREALREKARAWYDKNKERVLAARRRQRELRKYPTYAERVRSRKTSRAYYARHKDKILYEAFLKRRKETPEQLEERREYNREAAKRYRAYCHMRDDVR